MQYDVSFRQTASLSDGSKVLLRTARPSDKELLRRGFARMSRESRYRRFFSDKPELSESELRYLTEVDNIDHVAIGVVRETDDGEEGLGIARFVRDVDDPQLAEPAMAVVDSMQGQGVGTLLLHHLVAAALERGISSFHCTVLADNASMKHLLEEISDAVRYQPVGNGIVDVTLPLAPNDAKPAQSPARRMLSHVAREAVTIPLGRRLMARAGLLDED